MLKDLLPFEDKLRGKSIAKNVEKGFKIISESWADMQKIPDPTDNPIAIQVRTSHLPLELKGQTILTQLTDAKRMSRPDRRVQLKAIEKEAKSFPQQAEIWAGMVRSSVRAEGVGYPRPTQKVHVDLVTSVPESPRQNNNPTLSSSSPDSNSPVPLSQINIPHPVHNLPMDLVRAINCYVTPPASPTNHEPWRSEGNLDLPSESTSSDTLIEGVAFSSVTTTSISDSDIQSALTGMATLCIQGSAFPESTDTCNNITQKESVLCPAIAA